jgi:hypothetical protein
MKKSFFILLLLVANFVFSQGGYSPISRLRLTTTPVESNSNTQILVRDGSSGNVNYVRKDSLVVVPNLDKVTDAGAVTANSLSVGGVGINTTTPEAVLDVVSTESGILIPRLTESERDAISDPINSMLIFNSDIENFQFYFDSVWYDLGGGDLQTVTDLGNLTTNEIVIQIDDDITQIGQGAILLSSSTSINEVSNTGISVRGGMAHLRVFDDVGELHLGDIDGEGSTIKTSDLSENRQLLIPDLSGTIATAETTIPLSGTTEGNPVTGDVEVDNFKGFISKLDGDNYGRIEFDEIFPRLYYVLSETDLKTVGATLTDTQFLLQDENLPNFKGIVATNDYSTVDPTNKLVYAQRQYVENQFGKLISLTTTEILAIVSPEEGRLYYNSTLNDVVFYDGSNWKKLSDSNM